MQEAKTGINDGNTIPTHISQVSNDSNNNDKASSSTSQNDRAIDAFTRGTK